ncbi:MAG: amidohydrolase family protein [Proteobacteria bacterium]|nr:amidohydrolase family protein [Pseudomonadota bacterium]
MMVIDAHAHIAPQEFIEEVRGGKFKPALAIERGTKWDLFVTKTTLLGKERIDKIPLPRETYDLNLRFQHMDQMGVDKQILSIIPPCMYYTLDAGLNKEISAVNNDIMAHLAQKMPQRFSCTATVPLQDAKMAAEELDRAVQQGHIGVEIGSNIGGKNLDDRALDVFWEKVASLDVPVFIHPNDVMGIEDRLQDYYLRNFIGNPLDTTIAAACLIFGGVLDRFPNLKILLAHMGGYTPWIRGRWQHGYGEREEPKVNQAKAPENYIQKLYYDTIIHNADCFEFGVKTIGADRILYATDYPFDMGYLGPAKEIPGLSRLAAEDQEKILSANAKRLYKL